MPIYYDSNGKQYRTAVETDFGGRPFVADIHKASLHNDNFRMALWTGQQLQVTLMSIPPGGDIGLEMHPDVEQFLLIESGSGVVHMGEKSDLLPYNQPVYPDSAILIPKGTWHNLVNLGNELLKLYSIYAPPEHPQGTIHATQADDPHHL